MTPAMTPAWSPRMELRQAVWKAAAAAAVLSFSAVTLATPKLASCLSCSPMQREIAALAVTPDPGFAEVFVVDSQNESVHKYEATIDREPGLFVTAVHEMPLSQAELAPFREVWRAVAASKEMSVPSGVCDGVATYLYDSGCRGRVSTFLREGDGTLASNVNGLIAGGVVTLQQALSAVGANKQVSATLRFSDGSVLRVKLTFSVEVDSSAFSILKIDLVEAIGPGPDFVSYPLTAEAIGGLVVENASVRTVDDLARLFRSWGVEIVRGCTPISHRTRMHCDRLPPPGSPSGTLPRCTVTTGC